jgi:hypothetical protein
MNWLSTFKEEVSRCGFFRHVLAVALSAYGQNFDPTTTSTAANTTSFYLSLFYLSTTDTTTTSSLLSSLPL